MNRTPQTPAATPTRALTFRNGGWVIAIAALPALVVLVWGIAGAFVHDAFRLGDGKTIESYGFNLENLLVQRNLIVPGTDERDRIPALFRPHLIDGADVARLNEEERGKYLVSDDRVVGVVINGEARAYPVRMLDVHEVINDQIGEVPFAVTYSPWADSVAVFDRRVGDEPVQFAVSGLLYNANLVMYDRHDESGNESLWSQMEARAISGDFALRGAELSRLPFTLCRWRDWLAAHPDTAVIERNPMRDMKKHYERNTYGPYFSQGTLREEYPVAPLPSGGAAKYMMRVVVVRVRDVTQVYSVDQMLKDAGARNTWETTINNEPIVFTLREIPPTVVAADSSGASPVIAQSFWFGWFAAHPDAVIENAK